VKVQLLKLLSSSGVRVADRRCNSPKTNAFAHMGVGKGFQHWMTLLGVATARPGAFLVFAGYALSWLMFEPATLEWHSIATLATWFMTLVIQRAEHRDTQALQAKLDEAGRSTTDASRERWQSL